MTSRCACGLGFVVHQAMGSCWLSSIWSLPEKENEILALCNLSHARNSRVKLCPICFFFFFPLKFRDHSFCEGFKMFCNLQCVQYLQWTESLLHLLLIMPLLCSALFACPLSVGCSCSTMLNLHPLSSVRNRYVLLQSFDFSFKQCYKLVLAEVYARSCNKLFRL